MNMVVQMEETIKADELAEVYTDAYGYVKVRRLKNGEPS